jgi:hypothetical protein
MAVVANAGPYALLAAGIRLSTRLYQEARRMAGE